MPSANWPISDRGVAHPARLSPEHPRFDEIVAAHDAAVAAGLETYVDPDTGFLVMTREFLRQRGTCCHSGCRHCPYLEDPNQPEAS